MLTYMVFMICAACSVGKVHLKGQLEQNLFEVQNEDGESNHISTRAEYVTKEKFDETVSTLTSAIDKLNNDFNSYARAFDSFRETTRGDVTSLKGSISTLTDNYNRRTVKQCLSGVLDTTSGVKTITFSPSFSDTPKFTYGLIVYDDAGSRVRLNTAVKSISRYSASVQMTTWDNSRIAWSMISWMACK